jgi:hypothetical protein
MIEQARHVPLRSLRWSDSEAAAAIEDIVTNGHEPFEVSEIGKRKQLEVRVAAIERHLGLDKKIAAWLLLWKYARPAATMLLRLSSNRLLLRGRS